MSVTDVGYSFLPILTACFHVVGCFHPVECISVLLIISALQLSGYCTVWKFKYGYPVRISYRLRAILIYLDFTLPFAANAGKVL